MAAKQPKNRTGEPRPRPTGSKPAAASAPRSPTVRAPSPPPDEPDPQEIYDRSVGEYEAEPLRETEVEPGEGINPVPIPAPPRAGSRPTASPKSSATPKRKPR